MWMGGDDDRKAAVLRGKAKRASVRSRESWEGRGNIRARFQGSLDPKSWTRTGLGQLTTPTPFPH